PRRNSRPIFPRSAAGTYPRSCPIIAVIPMKRESGNIRPPAWKSRSSGPKFGACQSSLSRRTQPDRSVVEHRAAAGKARIGAGQKVDADALLEGVVWPQPLDDDDARLHPVEPAGVDD